MKNLQIQNVKKSYPGFDLDLSLDVPEDTVIGVLGLNGAGKSTLFKCILGLDQLDGGQILLDGIPVQELSPAQKERIGVVFPASFFPPLFTAKNIEDVMAASYREFDKDHYEQLLKRFELPEKKKIKDFSTGMTARLKVICALCHNADLLILDEPTAGLDVLARDEILDLLREYMEVPGRTILISSHISSDLETFCDSFCLIHKGRIIWSEDADTLNADYGVAQLNDTQLHALGDDAFLATEKTGYGVNALTKDRRYVQENLPDVPLEKASLDDVMEIMIRGEH